MSNVVILILVGAAMFAILGGVTLLSHFYNLNNIKSKTVGDGQHGTARWATKKEIKQTYNIVVDLTWTLCYVSAEFAITDNSARVNFEGCMPIEIMAKRGLDTLRFGPLKPVGFTDLRTARRPYAVVQLRQDNSEGNLYNIVGFQTNLKFGEQKRVFSMIPGLENANFVKYGVMHRNTYINSTMVLDNTYNMKENENIYFAGQITGVEGYVESIASGFIAGINAANKILGRKKFVMPKETVNGALADYISTENDKFQPMNANFGILPKLEENIRDKKVKYQKMADRSLDILKIIKENV